MGEGTTVLTGPAAQSRGEWTVNFPPGVPPAPPRGGAGIILPKGVVPNLDLSEGGAWTLRASENFLWSYVLPGGSSNVHGGS